MAFHSKELAKAYWRENVKLLLSLLFVWALVSFGFGIVFVDALNQIQLFGFKLGFWFRSAGLDIHLCGTDFCVCIQNESPRRKIRCPRRLGVNDGY